MRTISFKQPVRFGYENNPNGNYNLEFKEISSDIVTSVRHLVQGLTGVVMTEEKPGNLASFQTGPEALQHFDVELFIKSESMSYVEFGVSILDHFGDKFQLFQECSRKKFLASYIGLPLIQAGKSLEKEAVKASDPVKTSQPVQKEKVEVKPGVLTKPVTAHSRNENKVSFTDPEITNYLVANDYHRANELIRMQDFLNNFSDQGLTHLSKHTNVPAPYFSKFRRQESPVRDSGLLKHYLNMIYVGLVPLLPKPTQASLELKEVPVANPEESRRKEMLHDVQDLIETVVGKGINLPETANISHRELFSYYGEAKEHDLDSLIDFKVKLEDILERLSRGTLNNQPKTGGKEFAPEKKSEVKNPVPKKEDPVLTAKKKMGDLILRTIESLDYQDNMSQNQFFTTYKRIKNNDYHHVGHETLAKMSEFFSDLLRRRQASLESMQKAKEQKLAIGDQIKALHTGLQKIGIHLMVSEAVSGTDQCTLEALMKGEVSNISMSTCQSLLDRCKVYADRKNEERVAAALAKETEAQEALLAKTEPKKSRLDKAPNNFVMSNVRAFGSGKVEASLELKEITKEEINELEGLIENLEITSVTILARKASINMNVMSRIVRKDYEGIHPGVIRTAILNLKKTLVEVGLLENKKESDRKERLALTEEFKDIYLEYSDATDLPMTGRIILNANISSSIRKNMSSSISLQDLRSHLEKARLMVKQVHKTRGTQPVTKKDDVKKSYFEAILEGLKTLNYPSKEVTIQMLGISMETLNAIENGELKLVGIANSKTIMEFTQLLVSEMEKAPKVETPEVVVEEKVEKVKIKLPRFDKSYIKKAKEYIKATWGNNEAVISGKVTKLCFIENRRRLTIINPSMQKVEALSGIPYSILKKTSNFSNPPSNEDQVAVWLYLEDNLSILMEMEAVPA